jgi:hypothetical protein
MVTPKIIGMKRKAVLERPRCENICRGKASGSSLPLYFLYWATQKLNLATMSLRADCSRSIGSNKMCQMKGNIRSATSHSVCVGVRKRIWGSWVSKIRVPESGLMLWDSFVNIDLMPITCFTNLYFCQQYTRAQANSYTTKAKANFPLCYQIMLDNLTSLQYEFSQTENHYLCGRLFPHTMSS